MNNKFDRDDQIGREKFKQDFNKHYHIEDTQEFDHTDMMMTGITNHKTYNVELKKRNYDIQELSGSTILEKTKLDAFREAQRHDKDRSIVYFNFYNDWSWIAFDLSGRIKYNEGLNKIGKHRLPKNTSDNGEMIDKEVIYLHYTNNIYVQDRIYITKHS